MSENALLDQPPLPQQEGGSGNQEPPNKYVYPEFAGYSGERYLDTLIQQILPYALWRTWHYAVDYQAPGNVCYVGTARLASRVKPGIRKIELDFQELIHGGEQAEIAMCAPERLQPCGIGVAGGRNLRQRTSREIADEVWAPITTADYAYREFWCHKLRVPYEKNNSGLH